MSSEAQAASQSELALILTGTVAMLTPGGRPFNVVDKEKWY